MLNDMVLCEELFHTPSGVAFADFITEGHRETWPIRSKRFRTWLRRCHDHTTGPRRARRPSGRRYLLEARAQFDAAERAVSTRVAEHAGRLYLDLADEHWRPVAIGPTAGECLGARQCVSVERLVCCRCRYRSGRIDRSPAVLPQSSESERLLVGAWLLAALRSSGPHRLLAISGEQGSAKTVLSTLLRELVDPNVAPVAAARALQADDCGQQWPSARVR
jgi:hypothetical protein